MTVSVSIFPDSFTLEPLVSNTYPWRIVCDRAIPASAIFLTEEQADSLTTLLQNRHMVTEAAS